MSEMNNNIEDLVTVLLFTSPVYSNPSTICIQRAVKTINKLWGLKNCRKIIVCDGFSTDKNKMFTEWSFTSRAKIDINTIEYDKYLQYIEYLKILTKIDDDFKNVEIVVSNTHGGLTGSTKIGLELSTTPLTLHFEHDYYAISEIDILKIASEMINKQRIKYIRFNLCDNWQYDIFDKNCEKSRKSYCLDTILEEDNMIDIPVLKTDGWASLPHLIGDWYKKIILDMDHPFHHHEIYRIIMNGIYRTGFNHLNDIMMDRHSNDWLKIAYKKGFDIISSTYGAYVYGKIGDGPVIRHLDGSYIDAEEYHLMQNESERKFVPIGAWNSLMNTVSYTDPSKFTL